MPGAVGLNVTSRPLSSPAVHWLADGHATTYRGFPLPVMVSSEIGADHDSDAALTAGELANAADTVTITATSKPKRAAQTRTPYATHTSNPSGQSRPHTQSLQSTSERSRKHPALSAHRTADYGSP